MSWRARRSGVFTQPDRESSRYDGEGKRGGAKLAGPMIKSVVIRAAVQYHGVAP